MIFICNLKLGIFQIESSYIFEGGVPMYLAKVNYKKENVEMCIRDRA